MIVKWFKSQQLKFSNNDENDFFENVLQYAKSFKISKTKKTNLKY